MQSSGEINNTFAQRGDILTSAAGAFTWVAAHPESNINPVSNLNKYHLAGGARIPDASFPEAI